MPQEDISNWSELLVSLESLLVVRIEELDEYDDNYVRRHRGPIRARFGESDEAAEIGEIELWYIDGSRAADNSLNIVDVCDSLGQEEYVYASAVYTDGSIDASIIEGPLYNDVVVVRSLTLQPAYRGHQLEARIIRKIADVIGYHCAAVVFDPEQVGLSEMDELGIHPTKNRLLLCLTDF